MREVRLEEDVVGEELDGALYAELLEAEAGMDPDSGADLRDRLPVDRMSSARTCPKPRFKFLSSAAAASILLYEIARQRSG
jgi:hypothetical protein